MAILKVLDAFHQGLFLEYNLVMNSKNDKYLCLKNYWSESFNSELDILKSSLLGLVFVLKNHQILISADNDKQIVSR